MKFVSESHENAWNKALKLLDPTPAELEHGLELHQSCFAMDHFGFLPYGTWNEMFVDTWNELKAKNIGQRELSNRMNPVHYDQCCFNAACAERFRAVMRASGLKCMVHTVAEGKGHEADFKRMSCNMQLLRIFRDTIVQAGTPEDIRKINGEGKIAVIWSVNGPPFAGKLEDPCEELEWVDVWRRMGVRLMHMSYNRRNFAADGCAESADAGLSELGRELVAKLNEAGIIVDVPHTGKRSSIEAARVSEKPIMASHTGARALFDFIRCKDDETLRAIADKDGLIGVYAVAGMLGGSSDLLMMLKHIRYIADLIGVDHVGIGTDGMYMHLWPTSDNVANYANAEFSASWWGNWKDHPYDRSKSAESHYGSLAWLNWPLFTVGLVKYGFRDDEIARILGQNFLRVFEANRA
ncbi:MAG: membrane dipeptidase [Lentisphaeria bacterium]|nr:membrane dipeptidase [Lentisphaeria bacterium]